MTAKRKRKVRRRTKKAKPSFLESNKKFLSVIIIAIVAGMVFYGAITGFFISPQSSVPEPQTIPQPTAGKLTLAFDDGSLVTTQSALLDEDSVIISGGKIDISDLTQGSHRLIIIVNNIEYEEDFYYEGEGITITIAKPIETHVAVFSKELNQPISNVNVYLEGENKCTTGFDGTCSFFAKPDRYTIRLQGEGIFHEEIKPINRDSYSFTFKVEKELTAEITVLDELTNEPLVDVSVYCDGFFKGKTSTSGSLTIKDIKEGSHSIRVEYKSVSKDSFFDMTSSQRTFTIKIKAPRTVTLNVRDSETNKPVDNEKIYLNGMEMGYTAQDGSIKIVDILPGSYLVTVGTINVGSKNILTQNQISIPVNMPNPILTPTGTMVWNMLHTKVKCKIKAINTGTDTTKGPVGLCFVYEIINNTPVLKGSDSILFGNIAPNSETPYKESIEIGVPWNPLTDEDIVIIFFDTHEYLPSQEQSLTLQTTQSFASQVMQDVYSYCSSNPERCAEIAGTFVGGILQTI